MPQLIHRADQISAAPSGAVDPVQAEIGALVAENLEYMALLSRCARTLGLCATLDLEPLCERIVESLCVETGAGTALLWRVESDESDGLHLAAAWSASGSAPDLRARPLVPPAHDAAASCEPGCAAALSGESDGAQAAALTVHLRHEGRLLALARVTDPAGADGFGARELAAAEQIADAAGPALSNALRLRVAERRSFRDPTTRTCTPAFFDALVATELEKTLRFGRQLSLIEGVIAPPPAPGVSSSTSVPRAESERFLERLQQVVRGTDLCAADGDGRFRLLLPETDALGAAVLERRVREVACAHYPGRFDARLAAPIRLAAVTFPADGARPQDLSRRLAERLEAARHGLARELARSCRSFAECRQRLQREALAVPPRLPEQALRFALEELRRSAGERALVWLSAGAELHEAALEELVRMRGHAVRAEIVLIAEEDPGALAGLPITWISTSRARVRPGFLICLGETLAYAWLRERDGEGGRLFHSSDRSLVAHLAFELQRDLGRTAA